MKYKGFNCINKTQKRWVDSLIDHMLLYYSNLETGSTILDKRGKGNNGTVNQTLTNTTGPNGQNLKTFAASGNISLPINDSLNFTEKLTQITGTPLVNAHQGVTTDGNCFYVFHTNVIKKFDAGWNLIESNNNVTTEVGATHIGDGFYYDGKIYSACENWTDCSTFSNQRIGVWNASDLSFIKYYDISAQGAEISGCCINPNTGIVYVTCYCDYKIRQYSISDFSYLGYITLSAAKTYIQGAEYYNNSLYVRSAEGLWCTKLDGTIKQSVLSSQTGPEGLCISNGILYQLVDTNGDGTGVINQYKINNTNFTAILWVNIPYLPSEIPTTFMRIFGCDTYNDEGIALFYRKSPAQLEYKITSAQGSGDSSTRARILESDSLLKKNTFMMLSITFQDGIATVYANRGQTSATGTHDYIGYVVSQFKLLVGGSNSDTPTARLYGNLGELALVNYPMNADEISKFYDMTHGKYGV